MQVNPKDHLCLVIRGLLEERFTIYISALFRLWILTGRSTRETPPLFLRAHFLKPCPVQMNPNLCLIVTVVLEERFHYTYISAAFRVWILTVWSTRETPPLFLRALFLKPCLSHLHGNETLTKGHCGLIFRVALKKRLYCIICIVQMSSCMTLDIMSCFIWKWEEEVPLQNQI